MDDGELLVALRVADEHLEHEPVDLRLGKRVRAPISIGFCVASTRNGAGDEVACRDRS